MEYLGRPVFPFTVTHSDPWSGDFVYDAVSKQVGGGATQYLGTTRWQVRKLDVTALADNVLSIETFFRLVRGRAIGFWVPLVHTAFPAIGSLSDTSTVVVLGDTIGTRWGLSPRVHLWIVDGSGNGYARAVDTAVVDGTNTVFTLTEALPSAPDESWTVSPLPYVRFSGDELKFAPLGGGILQLDTSLVELPFEYETAGTPAACIYLYALGYVKGTSSSWQYATSWGASVTGTDGKLFTTRPLEHGRIKRKLSGSSVTLTALSWDDSPLDDQFPVATDLPLQLRIYRATWDWTSFAETGTRTLIFSGEVRNSRRQGKQLSIKFESGAELFTRELPSKVYSRTCTTRFCGPDCTLARSNFTLAGTVQAFESDNAGFYVDVLCADLATAGGLDWLALGYVGSPEHYAATPCREYESRPILGGTALGDGVYRLQVRHAFRWLEVGATCYLYAGCARTYTVCAAKITKTGVTVDNSLNFQGHPHIPVTNPQSETTAISSGKKSNK